jgi:hemolysin activation/secretion protein
MRFKSTLAGGPRRAIAGGRVKGWAVWWTLLCCPAVLAQQVPPSVEPGRAEERLRQPREPQRAQPAAPVSPPTDVEQRPANAASLTFKLRKLSVEGATVYSSEALTSQYASLIGQEISLDRLYTIAGELTARYRNDGYLLSSVVVPAQSIREGHAQLKAVEGYLASVAFEGDVDRRAGMFESMRGRLLADRPLRTATLERVLLLVNDLPGTLAQAVLQPAAATPGATDLVVRVDTSAVSGSAGATHRGSEVQGPVHYEAGLDLRSVFGLHEGTTLRYLQASKRDELWLTSLAHVERLTANGLDLTAAGSISRSDPELGPLLDVLNLETDTEQASLALSYPLIRARAGNLRVRGALTYHDGATDSDFGLLSKDKIAAARVGLSFDSLDALGGVNLVDFEASQGLDAFGSSAQGDPLASRVGADPEFSKATLYLARLQSLGARWSVLFAASGQLAFTNLLAPEEFAFGGEFYGRAYDPSEIVGDSGVAGKVELRYTQDPTEAWGFMFYGFYEAGKVWRRLDGTEAGADKEESATSAGAGARFSFGAHASAYIEGAVPLNRIVAVEGNDDARVFGGVQVTFGR